MQWLLDTNAWITLLKGASAELVSQLAERHDGDIWLCSVVKGELWHGAQKYANREKRLARLAELFARHARCRSMMQPLGTTPKSDTIWSRAAR